MDFLKGKFSNIFKKQESQSQEPLKCNHKWKDFDWYVDGNYNGQTLLFKVYEPYVCVICHERKDVLLFKQVTQHKTMKGANEWAENFVEKTPQIKARAEIEDAINDFIMVDREYLNILEGLRNGKNDIPKL